MNENIKVLKQRVHKNDRVFIDLYISWVYGQKTYFVRLKPVFGRDYDKLVSIAQEVPENELVEKYI